MNRFKFFDRPQLLISIIGIASLSVSSILLVTMVLTGEAVYLEDGTVDYVIYNSVISNLHTFFVVIHLLMVTWFAARAITYKMRKKEADIL